MRLYVSCPLAVPSTKLDEVLSALKDRGHSVIYYERGEKYGEKHTSAIKYGHGMVVILPYNAFIENIEDLSAGVRSEIDLAIDHNTPIYLAYVNSYNGLEFYETKEFDEGIIQGRPGSTDNPVNKGENLDMKAVEKAVDRTGSIDVIDSVKNPIEKRLLLLK